MQSWYWDYPKTGSGFSWADTLTAKAAALKQAGVTHIWFPPHTVASFGTNSNGYDPKDLFIGNQTTGLGTRPALNAMLQSFTAAGITPVADMIYNHRDGGRPEVNTPVKNYVTTIFDNNGGSNPYPSDRFRCALPVSTASGSNGYTTYYFQTGSKTGARRFNGKAFQVIFWTNKTGLNPTTAITAGTNPNNNAVGCPGRNQTTVTLNQPISASIIFGTTCNAHEFAVTLNAGNCNAVDTLFFSLVNPNGDYADQRAYGLYSLTRGGTNFVNDVLYQTYTNFVNMPSAPTGTITIGGSAVNVNGNFENFKPNSTNTAGGGRRADG